MLKTSSLLQQPGCHRLLHAPRLQARYLCQVRQAATPAQRAQSRRAALGGALATALCGAAALYATSRRQPAQQVLRVAPPPLAPVAEWPRSVEDMADIVAANAPVFYLHPRERHFPCTVDWFLARSELRLVRKGWQRRVLGILEPQGELTGAALQRRQEWFDRQPSDKVRRRLMETKLDKRARRGQPPECMNEVPLYAHVKEVVDPVSGMRTALEINYMKFLAFNGWYKLWGWLYLGEIGAHDADWEHVTVRLTPDGRRVLGAYYSAHRHFDGVWRSADEMDRTPNGRPRSFVAINGHGSYPEPGFVPRNLLLFNDDASDAGPVWDAKSIEVVTPCGCDNSGRLPSVPDRGSELNGSSYPSPHLLWRSQQAYNLRQSATQPAQGAAAPAGGNVARLPISKGAVSEAHAISQAEEAQGPGAGWPRTILTEPAWLAYSGRWGAVVDAPARQDWFYKAENPVSRSWLAQVLLPLLPGVESIWEPAVEEVAERVETARQAAADLMAGVEGELGKPSAARTSDPGVSSGDAANEMPANETGDSAGSGAAQGAADGGWERPADVENQQASGRRG